MNKNISLVKNRMLIVIIAVVVLSSCDHEYGYTYKVLNNADSEVKFDLVTDWVDSTYLIEAGATSTLFITSHGFEGPDGPYFADVAGDLSSGTVTKYDTIISNKDYLKNSSWEFNEGVYKAVLTDKEFE